MTKPVQTEADRQATNRPTIQVTASRGFPAWLADQRISLALTTYESHKLLLLGRRPDGRLAVFERTFPRCMGLWSDSGHGWLSRLDPGTGRLEPIAFCPGYGREVSRPTRSAAPSGFPIRAFRAAGSARTGHEALARMAPFVRKRPDG